LLACLLACLLAKTSTKLDNYFWIGPYCVGQLWVITRLGCSLRRYNRLLRFCWTTSNLL
jgi:hypothetical protein